MEPQPQQTAPPPPRWGVGDFLMGLVAGLALSTLFASGWLAFTGDKDLDLTGQALSQVGLWTGMLGSVFLASHRKGTGSLAEDFGFKARWSDIGLGAMVASLRLVIPIPFVPLLITITAVLLVLEVFVHPLERASQATIDKQVQAEREWAGTCDRLSQVSRPTLVVTGSDDQATPPANSLMLAERIPNAWLAYFAGGGHGMMYQYPEQFAATIENFLQSP